REIGEVAAKRAQSQLAVTIDIDLADLQKPPVGRKQAEARGNRMAGKRVEHHVDASAACELHDLVAELERARIEHMLDPHCAHGIALFGSAGGSKYFGPGKLCELQRGLPNTACCGVDQHPLAGA